MTPWKQKNKRQLRSLLVVPSPFFPLACCVCTHISILLTPNLSFKQNLEQKESGVFRKRVVLITQRLMENATYPETRQAQALGWGHFLNDLGGCVPVPMVYGIDPASYFDIMDVAGVILTGGNDIVEVYNETTPEKPVQKYNNLLGNGWTSLQAPKMLNDLELSTLRDGYEAQVFKAATSRGVPVLGVCRGLQFLASSFGAEMERVKGHSGTVHPVSLVDNAQSKFLRPWAGRHGNPLEVNSYHNWAIKHTPAFGPLVPVLLSPEGHVEAVEGRVEKSNVVAIMWHPERTSKGHTLDADKSMVRKLFALPKKSCSQTRAVVLCAGQGTRLRPMTNSVPKCMVKYQGRSIIDYILPSLRSCGVEDICLATGYLENVLKRPNVRYCLNPDYDKTNMVASLFCARHELEHNGDVIVSYSDIVYIPSIVDALLACKGDICVVVDRDWRAQWESRMEDPLSDAETLKIGSDGNIIELGKKPKSYDEIEGQYIGLMKFSPRGLKLLMDHYDLFDKNGTFDGKDFDNMYMTSLIQSLINADICVTPVFINGGWTEVDCPTDLDYKLDTSSIPNLTSCLPFGTKAENLEQLGPLLTTGSVVPALKITVDDFADAATREAFVQQCLQQVPPDQKFIVRSSAKSEDTATESNAGKYESVDGVVHGKDSLEHAIKEVIASYGGAVAGNDQVLVQKSLTPVAVCGVLFTADLETHLSYFVLSFDTRFPTLPYPTLPYPNLPYPTTRPVAVSCTHHQSPTPPPSPPPYSVRCPYPQTRGSSRVLAAHVRAVREERFAGPSLSSSHLL
jgi:choline kinase/gamma-glutamyl-gamma-aminobutyrate hydrolase PuuD